MEQKREGEDVAYKGVVYARSAAIIAEAVKELREETNKQFAELLKQMDDIRKENAELREKILNCKKNI